MSRERLTDIDRAKGLAISLVVIGHVITDEFPPGNDWCLLPNLIIYKFHMAFFMFITGFVMFYTYPEMHALRDYVAYVRKKFVRLIPAYLLFAIVVTAGKSLAGRFMQVVNPVDGFQDLIDVLVRPSNSCCRSLWYIYVIFIYFLLIPPLLRLFKGNLGLLLLFGLAVYFLPRSAYFCEKRVCDYMFIFLLGGYAVRHRDLYLHLIDRYAWAFLLAFASCILLYLVVDVPKLLFGLVSIPALHSLVRTRTSEKVQILTMLGKYAFPIYLLNSLVIGGLTAVLQTWWSLAGANYPVAAPLLIAAGFLVPIVFYDILIRRVPVLNTIIRA